TPPPPTASAAPSNPPPLESSTPKRPAPATRPTLTSRGSLLEQGDPVKHDKDLDGLRAELARKEKELAEAREDALNFRRRTTTTSERLGEIERAKGELQAQVASLKADKELAAKRADDLRARIAKGEAQVEKLQGQLTASKQTVSTSDAAHKEALRELEAAH